MKPDLLYYLECDGCPRRTPVTIRMAWNIVCDKMTGVDYDSFRRAVLADNTEFVGSEENIIKVIPVDAVACHPA